MPSSPQFITVVLAFLASAAIGGAAYRARSLSASGAVAAAIGGTLSICAGWPWGLFLVVWFLYASAISQLGQRRKARHTAGIVAKGGRRDAGQVLANGGVFFGLAAIGIGALTTGRMTLNEQLAIAAAASLVAAGADTTATEVGTWWRGEPLSLRTWRRVPSGTSGAVSMPGTLAMLVAAAALSGLASAAGLIPAQALWPVAMAGVVGAMVDTALGATLQVRRHCPACGEDTEQPIHRCGAVTTINGGVAGLNNDVVNLLCTVAGALTAAGWM